MASDDVPTRLLAVEELSRVDAAVGVLVTLFVTNTTLNVQSYIDRGEMKSVPKVAEGDVVIVYARWYDWKTVLSVLNNVLLIIVTLQAFGGVFK